MEKEQKINIFKAKLNSAFVENFDEINKAKNLINTELKISNVKFKYDYNTFCKEMLAEGVKLASKVEDIENIVLVNFLYVLLNNMIVNKKGKI